MHETDDGEPIVHDLEPADSVAGRSRLGRRRAVVLGAVLLVGLAGGSATIVRAQHGQTESQAVMSDAPPEAPGATQTTQTSLIETTTTTSVASVEPVAPPPPTAPEPPSTTTTTEDPPPDTVPAPKPVPPVGSPISALDDGPFVGPNGKVFGGGPMTNPLTSGLDYYAVLEGHSIRGWLKIEDYGKEPSSFGPRGAPEYDSDGTTVLIYCTVVGVTTVCVPA